MQDFLVFENVTKRFGNSTAVDHVSFGVSAGEIFSLLGPSGCGKTTLLRMVAGFISPDEGRILLEGRDIATLPPEKRPVNTVFQNYALFPHMSVCDNIGFGLRMARRAKSDIARETDRALELVGLRDHGDKRPAELSGGQRQRVAIARALVNRPRVLLLDEPLAALDLKLRQRLLVELDAIHDEVGTTFLYVTHDQGEAMSISDHIAVMWDGRVEQIGTPPQIYEAPDNSFVAAFIGDTNFIKGRVIAPTDAEHSRMDANGLGPLLVYNDRSIATGERVVLSVRPEKIAIQASPPQPSPYANTVAGRVEDVIYLGAQTRFGVRAGDMRFIVEFPHRRYQLDEKVPTWGDEVWLTWHADDGYLLREYDEEDQTLLSFSSTEEE